MTWMNNDILIFENEEFGDIRTFEANNEPWFLAADICKALGLSNPTTAMDRLDPDEKAKFNLGLRGGEVNCVNEYGLYNLVLASRKEGARRFKRWITHEVIPQIRKTGGYQLPQTYSEALRALADKAEEADRLMLVNKKLEEQNTRMRPKEIFADAVAASKTSILVGELAKLITQNGYEIGQKRLFSWLRGHGYLMQLGESYNMPTQRAIQQGLFEIKESSIQNPDGSVRITKTTKVTGKGQQYFINKFIGGMA